MSDPSDHGDTDFEDDFDDELDEFDEVEDYILSPKLSANFVNV